MSSINDKLNDPAFQQKTPEVQQPAQPKGQKTKILIAKIKGDI